MMNQTAGFRIPAMIIFCSALVFANTGDTKTALSSLDQSARAAGDNGPGASVLNINNLMIWVDRDGFFPWTHTYEASWAAEYPKGTASLIFAEGMLWGAKVDDAGTRNATKPRIRVNGATYATGLKAGKVLYDASGNVIGADENPGDRHVWRVRRDYQTADLTEDAASFFTLSIEAVTSVEIQAVYDQYDYDRQNWPAVEGAPFEDVNGDGNYDPLVDIPGEPGAAQTIWLVVNDLPYADGTEVAPNSYGSPATGMELQLTMWAYDFSPDYPLGNVIFKRARMIYTGLVGGPADAKLDTVYFAQWSDPDLGTYTDDFVGCDTTLSLGYVYNGNTLDGIFFGDFGLPVPAGGYQILQGPIAGGDTLGMTSFWHKGSGSSISDPDLGEYSGTLQWFNLMEGFLPRPEYPAQTPWTDPVTGEITKFPVSGDPVTGSGWIDGIILPPGDRRMALATGPFTMALGDTQDVVIALIGAMGTDNISSLVELKKSAQLIRQNYNNDFVLVGFSANTEFGPLDSSEITINVETISSITAVTAVVSEVSGVELANVPLFDDGLHGDQEAGDFIFGARVTLAKTAAPLPVGFTITDGSDNYVYDDISRITVDGPLTVQGFTVGADFLNGNGAINPGEIVHLSLSLLNDGEFAHTGLAANVRFTGPVAEAGENHQYIPLAEPGVPVSVTYDMNNPDTYSELFVTESAQDGEELTANIILTDDLDNVWETTLSVPVELYKEPLDAPILAVHSAGTSSGSVTGKVIDFSALTGDQYEVYFNQQEYYLDFDGVWKPITPDSAGINLGKAFDLTGTTMSATSYSSPIGGTRDLKFILELVSPDYDYSDGVVLTFPSEITINSAEVAIGYYGTGLTPVIDQLANTVAWGSQDTSGDGQFQGNEVFTVNVDAPILPLDVDYIVWDDGWATTYGPPSDTLGAGIVHAVGTCTISEEDYLYKTENHWNLRNLTTDLVLFEDMVELGTFNNGSAPEGFVVRVDGSYVPPYDYNTYTHVRTDGTTDVFSKSHASAWLDFDQAGKPYIITSSGIQGWASSARASDPDVWGAGSSEIELLQADYELRFTGEYDDPVTSGSLTLHPIKAGTGSIATFVGARYYDPSAHPMITDVSTDVSADGYFLVRIPFEVWNTDTGEQIDLMIYDRMQDPSAGGDFYAFNLSDRMYCYVLNRPYTETIAAVESGGADEQYLTWNLIFWNTNGVLGDVVMFNYDNPIQLGVDLFTFTTAGLVRNPTAGLPSGFSLGQNYPNPFNSNTLLRYELPVATDVVLVIYDILGREVIRLVDEPKKAGYHHVIWPGQDGLGRSLASGVYIYRLTTPDYSRSRKMLLLK